MNKVNKFLKLYFINLLIDDLKMVYQLFLLKV